MSDESNNLDLLLSIGADHAIDYTREDFTQNGEQYDIVFDVVGKSSYVKSLKCLKPNGRYLLANVGLTGALRGRLMPKANNRKVISKMATLGNGDLAYLLGLMESGKMKAVIDRTYPLEQAVDALRYVESGDRIGHVVLVIESEQSEEVETGL